MGPVYLIDGSGYIFRAYYAIRHLTTSRGFPTNAIFGFTQMLFKFLKTCSPEYAAVVFDAKEPSFRHERFPAYKANRRAPPDDLIPQFPYFSKVVAGLGLSQCVLPGFEADDLIGTLARRLAASGREVIIITGDKDFMQLVDDRITLWDTMRDKRTDASGVMERFGVPPAQVIEVLGLAGDSVDNIPGVSGVGEKTAIKLIQEWGSVESVLTHAGEIKGKVGERLQADAAQARLSRELVTIYTEAPVPLAIDALQVQPLQQPALRALFHECEFTTLLQELAPQTGLSRAAYRLVRTAEELAALVERVRATGQLAIDTETTSLNLRQAELVGISCAVAPAEAYYIPLRHHYLGVPEQLPLEAVLRALGPLFSDPAIRKSLQHAKFDLPILQRHGFTVAGIVCDTMLASYLLNPAGPHGLDALARQYLDHTMIAFKEVVTASPGFAGARSNSEGIAEGNAKPTGRHDFSEVPLDEACAYAAEDVDVTLRLAERFLPELEREGLLPLLRDMELPLTLVLMRMEAAGIRVDVDLLGRLATEFRERLKEVEAEIYAAAGTTFNIASPKQLASVLFEKLQLKGARRTKTGFSTNADVLERLAHEHAVPRLVLAHRSLAKLLSTYIGALPKLVDPTTGRIHTSFNQTVAATGRLSSSDPNLQNIPIRSEEGRRIRAAFVAAPGHWLLSADYSQIELRILAHCCGDEGLCAAFRAGRDVHAQTAASLFGGTPEGVSDDQRRIGKTINFAVIYGQTAYGLAQQLTIPPAEAQQYIEQYFARYPGVAAYREAVLTTARETGRVQTLFGRRRFFPELGSHNLAVRANAERMAFNTVIQGTAADLIKLAMVQLDRRLQSAGVTARLLVQVHDELVLEVPEAERATVAALVTEAMEHVPLPDGTVWHVPLRVECAWGRTWADCQ